MKTKYSKFITAGLATAIITPAFALEGPADDAPPPQAIQQTASLPQIKLPPDSKPKAEATEIPETGTAFLGVVSGEVPEILAEHLELTKGQGVIVRAICPDSPAGESGIAVNDVITAISGSPITAREDLSKRIMANKPGDTIELDVIHKGEPAKISVTLGNRPSEVAAVEPPSLDQMDLENLPKEMADHIRDAIGGMELKLGGARNDLPPEIEEAIGAIQKRMLRGQTLLDHVIPPPAGANAQGGSSATFRMSDGAGSIEVKSKDNAREVTVRDHQDNVVWSGPWNTDQDRAAAPDSVRNRMESLHLDTNSTGGGLRFQLNGKPDPAAPDH